MTEATKEAGSKKKVVRKTPVKKPVVKKIEKSKDSFVVFATGGKQYRVSPGDSLKIEKLKGDHKEGDKIIFDQVLLVDDGKDTATIGTPFIKGAAVNATLKKISRYKTIDVIKYKQKSRYFKKYGHRQPYFEVTIDSIK
jgi:large subunit ribosomal protein L21